MSEEAVIDPSSAGAGDAHTAGQLLRQAREASGLHIAALAVAMKVPVKKLEALEANRLGELPDAVFVRALASSMCRALKLDPAPVLARLPQSTAPRLESGSSGVKMPTQGSGLQVGHSFVAFVSRPAVLLVAALLLGALVVVFFPSASNTSGTAEMAADTQAPPPGVVAAPPEPHPEAAPPAPSPAPVPALVVPPIAASIVAPIATPQAEQAAAPAKVGASEVGAVPSGILVFKANSRAWVRVSDSQGVVQFEKTLAAGETAVAPGTPPLSVVVGNVAATEVLLRGQPFQMQDVNQNNVARFEVK